MSISAPLSTSKKKRYSMDIDIELSSSVTPPNTSSVADKDEHSLHEQKRLYNDRLKKDTTWRCRLSWWVIIVDSVWLLAILLILAFNSHYIGLSDAVLMTLLGTTTINVLGLAFIVLKGLFENNNNKKQ